MSPAPKQLGVRLPARLNARLEALARAENNAVAATARRLLTQALDRLDEARSTEPPPQRAA
jgi:predicted transcriptional regulator